LCVYILDQNNNGKRSSARCKNIPMKLKDYEVGGMTQSVLRYNSEKQSTVERATHQKRVCCLQSCVIVLLMQ